MKKQLPLLASLILFLLTSSTCRYDYEKKEISIFQIDYLDCSGKIKNNWISSGHVSNLGDSNIIHFTDQSSKKQIKLVGTFIMTQVNKTKKFSRGTTNYKVKLLDCNHSIIKEWIAIGYVGNLGDSEIIYFIESTTKKEIRISGNIVITEM